MALLAAGNGQLPLEEPETAFGHNKDELRLRSRAAMPSKHPGGIESKLTSRCIINEQISTCMKTIAASPQAWGVAPVYIRISRKQRNGDQSDARL